MELMKCRMCGGTVTVNQEQGTAVCDYCGLTMLVPKASDDRLANLLERAGRLRERGEFDKALAIYEIVLAEAPRDPAAHWGALLSKYGIEYVEDPITHTPMPTCHRAQYESILADADYQNALEFANDESERLEFEQEARHIAEIQKGILAVSRQEAPYDVFICYKEQSDFNGASPPNKEVRAQLDIATTLKEASALVADGEFAGAEELLDRILRQDSMCVRAYFYKFMLGYRCRSTLELRQKATPDWFRQTDFAKALVLAKGSGQL